MSWARDSCYLLVMPGHVQVRFRRLSDRAIAPRVMQDGDVAADLHSPGDLTIPARERLVVETDLALELPPGYRGRIHARSGLAARHGIAVGAGLIDQGYRGNIGVLLFNHSDEPFAIHAGDRIAQLTIEPYWVADFEEVPDIADTARSAGWGSTGR